ANTRLAQSFSLGRIAGPGLGGVLVQVLSAPVSIAVDALSYLGAALFFARLEAVGERAGAAQDRRTVWSEIGEGIRFTLSQPLLRSLVGAVCSATLFNSAFFALYVLY